MSAAPVLLYLTAGLLGGDRKRQRRTAMVALATGMMVCCALVMHMLARGGNMNLQWAAWWAVFAVGGLLVVLVLVRSGWSERLSDPSMTMFQMHWALSCNAIAYVIVGPMRALVLPVLVIILMFGIFGRSRRQTVALMRYAMLLYTLAVLVAAWTDNPRPPLDVVLAHLTIVLLSVFTATLMCLQVQHMRTRLRQQKGELELALVQIRELAMRDDLTGLINRRQMTELMRLEQLRCQRNGRTLLLAQLDIDHFKAINDTHGHAVGDLALQAFADTATAHLRAGDVLARWGGEEFVLLLSNTTPEAATELLERVRCAVAAHTMPVPQSPATVRMTVSIGWTQHVGGEPIEHTLERADLALYDAKNQGRNRVVGAASTPATRPSSAPEWAMA